MFLNIKNPSKLTIGVLLAFFFGFSVFMRTYFTYHAVFVGDWIKYTTNDAYYQMRIVDLIVHNFPHLPKFDPYLIFPGGFTYGPFLFFNWLLAVIIWIFTLGSPTEHAINIIGVYFPVIIAALCVIPTYVIGKSLFNRWAGIIGAALVSFLPGEFLGRTILGATDYAVAETLFSTTIIMFLILAVKSAWQNRLSWNLVSKHEWRAFIKPFVYSILASFFIGIFMITWPGALLFVFIIAVYFVIQFVIDHLKGQSGFYLGFAGFFTFLLAFFIFLSVSGYTAYKASLLIAAFIPIVFAALSGLMARPGIAKLYYPVTILVIGAVAIIGLRLVDPVLFRTMMSGFPQIFHPGGATAATTIEMQPFLSPTGSFTTAVAWGNFSTSIFLIPWAPIPGFAIIALVVLGVVYFKQRCEDKNILLLFVWTLIMIIATLAQRRFAYYLVINMAILTGYLTWLGISWFARRHYNADVPETLPEQYKRSRLVGIIGGVFAFGLSFIMLHDIYFFIPVILLGLLSIVYGFWAWIKLKGLKNYLVLWAFVFPVGVIILASTERKQLPAKSTLTKTKKNKKLNRREANKPEIKTVRQEKLNPWLYRFNIVTLMVVAFISVFWPNWDSAKNVAAAATYAPSDAWQEALYWLKDNTPAPLNTNDYYSSLNLPAGTAYVYPDSAYAVTTWWDYGYWISRTAQRLPNDNPNQAAGPIRNVANLLLSENDQTTLNLMQTLQSSYVVIDDTMTTSKIWAVMVWANVNSDKYVQIYYYQKGTQIVPIQVYTPEYYQLFSVRLYNFNGLASVTEKPVVLTYENRTDSTGKTYRLATNAQQFNSYQEAQSYISSHPQENDVIVGTNPYVNPVPIQAVPDFKLVFSSTKNDATSVQNGTAEVKIFQYTGK